MPGQLDTIFRDLAPKLIGDFGSSATWKSTSEAYSAATGKTTVTETDYSIVISPPEPYNNRMIDGEVIQVGDAQCLLQGKGLAFTPAIADVVLHKTVRWKVVGLNPIYSGELIAAYEVQLRK